MSPRLPARVPDLVAGAGAVRRVLRAGLRHAVFGLPFLLMCWPPASVQAADSEYSWIKPRADSSLMLDLARAGNRWFAVGERGHVLISDDAEHWEQVRVPTRVLLTAVDASEGGLGFAVGHDAVIIRTRDNGRSWERVLEPREGEGPFLDVVIVDDQRIVAVGAYGLYAETNDGGETWDERVIEPEDPGRAGGEGQEDEDGLLYDFHLNDIDIAEDGRWYIAAEGGNIYRSDDQGESWLRLPSPYEGSFFGVLPLDSGRVLAFGLQGRLFLSGDAGEGWSRLETGTDATLSNGARLDGGDGFLISGYAGVLLTGAAGSKDTRLVTLRNRPAVSDARPLDDGGVLTVGEGGIHRWPAATMP